MNVLTRKTPLPPLIHACSDCGEPAIMRWSLDCPTNPPAWAKELPVMWQYLCVGCWDTRRRRQRNSTAEVVACGTCGQPVSGYLRFYAHRKAERFLPRWRVVPGRGHITRGWWVENPDRERVAFFTALHRAERFATLSALDDLTTATITAKKGHRP